MLVTAVYFLTLTTRFFLSGYAFPEDYNLMLSRPKSCFLFWIFVHNKNQSDWKMGIARWLMNLLPRLDANSTVPIESSRSAKNQCLPTELQSQALVFVKASHHLSFGEMNGVQSQQVNYYFTDIILSLLLKNNNNSGGVCNSQENTFKLSPYCLA